MLPLFIVAGFTFIGIAATEAVIEDTIRKASQKRKDKKHDELLKIRCAHVMNEFKKMEAEREMKAKNLKLIKETYEWGKEL